MTVLSNLPFKKLKGHSNKAADPIERIHGGSAETLGLTPYPNYPRIIPPRQTPFPNLLFPKEPPKFRYRHNEPPE